MIITAVRSQKVASEGGFVVKFLFFGIFRAFSADFEPQKRLTKKLLFDILINCISMDKSLLWRDRFNKSCKN